jgi:hypothetical protein
VIKTPTQYDLIPLSMTDGPKNTPVPPVSGTIGGTRGCSAFGHDPEKFETSSNTTFRSRPRRAAQSHCREGPPVRPPHLFYFNTRAIPLSHRRILSLPSSPNLQLPNPSSRAGAGDVSRRARVRRAGSTIPGCGELAGEREREAGARAGGDGGEADLGEPAAVQRPAGGGGEEAAQAGGARQQRPEAPAEGDRLPPRPLLRHELRAGALPQHTPAGLSAFSLCSHFVSFSSFFPVCPRRGFLSRVWGFRRISSDWSSWLGRGGFAGRRKARSC